MKMSSRPRAARDAMVREIRAPWLWTNAKRRGSRTTRRNGASPVPVECTRCMAHEANEQRKQHHQEAVQHEREPEQAHRKL